LGLSDAQAKVRAFHQKFGVEAPSSPAWPNSISQVAINRRCRWLSDELEEIHRARFLEDDNEFMAEVADGFIDIIYFALGGLVELGIDGGPLFDAVHAANMTKIKLPGVDKIAKPPGFVPPDIAALIEAQRTGK
jgi:predicted HAD superfamily Cof-like phosphohydrolase